MNLPQRQQGIASAIVAVILLVIIGGMVTISLRMSTGSLADTSKQSDHLQALFLAESHLERTVFNLNNGTSCGSLSIPDTQTYVGTDTSQLVSATTVSATSCLVKTQGTVNDTVAYIEATIEDAGGGGGGGGGGSSTPGPSHFEPFVYNNTADMEATWIENLTATEGVTEWQNVDCPLGTTCATAPPPGNDGAFYAATTGSPGWRTLTGYHEKDLSATGDQIDTTGTDIVSLTLTAGYRKMSSTGSVPNRTDLIIQLYDSAAGITTDIWSELNSYVDSGWQPINVTVGALPSGRIYDRLRIAFDFNGRSWGGSQAMAQAYVDEIDISTTISTVGTGGSDFYEPFDTADYPDQATFDAAWVEQNPPSNAEGWSSLCLPTAICPPATTSDALFVRSEAGGFVSNYEAYRDYLLDPPLSSDGTLTTNVSLNINRWADSTNQLRQYVGVYLIDSTSTPLQLFYETTTSTAAGWVPYTATGVSIPTEIYSKVRIYYYARSRPTGNTTSIAIDDLTITNIVSGGGGSSWSITTWEEVDN